MADRCWQNRPHDGLRDPAHPGRMFTPNEKYAALVEAAGYVPVALSAADYIELLPACWRAVNAYGIKISHRSYDGEELNPLRLQPSGVAARKNLWEVHHDPYDVSRIFVRGPEGWITCYWRHLDRVPVPFGELAWDHARRQLAADGRAATEQQIADTVAALLTPGIPGPGAEAAKMTKRDRRVAARTKAATPPRPRQRRAGQRPGANPCPARAARRRRATGAGHPAGDLRPVPGSGQALVNTGSAAAPGEEHRQLTTLEGWRRFTGDVPAVPELLAERCLDRPEDDKRWPMTRTGLITTPGSWSSRPPVIRKVITEGRRLSYLNRNAVSGRCGLILSGPAGTGKTTAITQLGKMTEVIHRQRHPRSGSDIPVIYITAPPAATPKMIAAEFARFLGLPVTRRRTSPTSSRQSAASA